MNIWIEDISRAKTPLQFIVAISRPFRRLALFSLFLATVGASANAILPLFYKNIVDAITALSEGGSYNSIGIWMLGYLGVFILQMAGWRLSAYYIAHWSTGVRATGRHALTAYLTRHSNYYFENRFAGSLANKINHATDGAREIVSNIAYEFWPLFVGLSISLVVAGIAHPYLGALFFSWLLLVIPLNIYLARRRVPYTIAAQESETRLRGVTVDLITNIRAMHEFARRVFELGELKKLILTRRRLGLRNWIFGEMVLVLNAVIEVLFLGGMFAMTLYLAVEGVISPGTIVLILALMFSVGRDIFYIGHSINTFAERWGEVREGLQDILNPYDVEDRKDARAFSVTEGAITFKNVSFSYGNEDTFSRLSFSIQPGEKIGLVGKSGAGKSTLVKLLLRHYDVSAGVIAIDGVNIAAVTQESLREAIAVVPQEPLLFHRSIKENIGYGKIGAADAEIMNAAKLAQAHDFIENLPQGYETLVGERGVKLSGGQRQRVAIARAILKDAKILVLDEATSSLDSESEIAIQKALHTLMEGKTVIAVAHRLSTLREMDRILVLDGGHIVEDGSHDELLTRGGIYAELWSHQAGGFIKDR